MGSPCPTCDGTQTIYVPTCHGHQGFSCGGAICGDRPEPCPDCYEDHLCATREEV